MGRLETQSNRRLNIVIAAGGTGGHLFPAQSLAFEMRKKHPNIEITFIGAGLKNNKYFDENLFEYIDIKSATPMKKHPVRMLKALFSIFVGILSCMKHLKRISPHLIISFGSFHTFPALFAGRLKNISMMVVELNVIPGRVNRLCSKWAQLSFVQFPCTAKHLKGQSICAHIPILHLNAPITQKGARRHFHLDPEIPTLLVFGGSQGARSINYFFCEALELLISRGLNLQVIHITGTHEGEALLRPFYEKRNILAYVKAFEEKMDYAWAAADLNISRAGAATLTELITFNVPSILIPYPYSTEGHQSKNAAYVVDAIHGGAIIEEKELSASILAETITDFLSGNKLATMREALHQFREKGKKRDLCSLILENT